MKNDIVSLFKKVTPIRSDEEILKGVLRKAEEMENSKIKNKARIKKLIVAVCTVITAATLGVTGAAAAGIIKFDKICGSYITAENAELGDTLISVSSGFSDSISADN